MDTLNHLDVERCGVIFIITLQRPPENRLTMKLCQDLISTYRRIEQELSAETLEPEGAVILRGSNAKFFTTGLDLDERGVNPFSSTDGFYPVRLSDPNLGLFFLTAGNKLLRTLLDFPFPTICLITGHTFGGACLLTLAHDYRIMNSEHGFWSMPPVNLGLHFDGMGSLLRAKLRPQVARTVLLEAHKFTGKEAFEAGIVDEIAPPEEMLDRAIALAEKVKVKAKMGVFALLRLELYGEALREFQKISHIHSREVSRQPKAKI